jgi:hypothetical protein
MQPRRKQFTLGPLVLSLAAILPLLSGCDGCNSAAVKKPAQAETPDEILQGMVKAYQAAKTYTDQGKVRVEYRVDGKTEQDEGPLAIAFERPNRLSVEAYQVELKCDGEKLYALISDQATADLDGQVVERPAPADLALGDVFADEEIHRALNRGPCQEPVQLELLLGEKPLELPLKSSAPKSLLPAQAFDNRECHRVEIKNDEGPLVFWIDKQDFTLRRLEYPTGELKKEIAAQLRRKPEEIESVSLSADFEGATVNGKVADKDFEFHKPAGAKMVRSFMRPPEPLPSELFGQRPRKFQFTLPDGEKVTQASLQGKIAVLMWFVVDEVSRSALSRLDKVREGFERETGVTFLAVHANEQGVTEEQLAKTVKAWGLQTQVARDSGEFGRTSFQVPVAPTLVILDAKGIVQIFEPGANPRLETELPAVLKRLLKGDDLAAELVLQSQRERAAYRDHLAAAASSEGGSTLVELPAAKIEPWQDPDLLTLTKLWSCAELKTPGNLLVIEEEGSDPRILANDGWRGIAELDSAGKVVARHELPPAASVSCLRTAKDKEGKRYYLAFAPLGKQLHLLDSQWNVLLSYPAAGQTHEGLRDVQLCDLDGDGKLEICLGFWGSVGVQAVDLSGKRLWSNRLLSTVLSLVETPPNEVGFRKLLATGNRGSILRINQFGNADPEIRVPNRALHHLYRSRFSGTRQTAYLGLSYLSERKVQAVALNEKLEEQWSYPLPEGVFRNQIEYVASGMMLDAPGSFADVPDGQWILAGANGSVHIVSDEGDFNDLFYSGESLSGIGCTRFDGSGVLLLSSDKGVTAWQVERK